MDTCVAHGSEVNSDSVDLEGLRGQVQSSRPGLVGWAFSEQVQTLPAWALHTTPTLPSQAHSQEGPEASFLLVGMVSLLDPALS